jgi:hypothetical protein
MWPPAGVQRAPSQGANLFGEWEIETTVLGRKNGITTPLVRSKQDVR